MISLTKSQARWLRRLRNEQDKWLEGPGNHLTLSFLVRHGLVEQRSDGRIRITAFGLRALLAQPLKKKPQQPQLLLYWAYGSNLNVKEMAIRCPGAKKVQALALPNGALVFRGVADAVYREGSTVHGGLWLITKEHEAFLDRYEGVSSKLYSKCYLKLLVNGEERQCLYYQMNEQGIYPPSDSYVERIAQGYRDFGLPMEALDAALQESWGSKQPTQYLIKRHVRRGGKLAKELKDVS